MIHREANLRFDVATTNSLRGVAILIITAFHVILYYDISPVFNVFGSVAVAVFLMLSGYGINESWKKHGLKHYWLKKVRRVVLPYWLFLLVVAAVSRKLVWRDFLLDISFIHSSYWFIEYLVRCYVVYWVARKFFPRHAMAVLLAFGLLSLHLFMQIEAEQSFSFFLGVVASEQKERLYAWKPATVRHLFWGSLGVGMFFYLFKAIPAIHQFKGTWGYVYLLVPIKLSWGISLVLAPYYLPAITRSGFLHVLGRCSLELYLVHMALLPCLVFGVHGALLYVALTVVLTALFYLFDTRLMPKVIPLKS